MAFVVTPYAVSSAVTALAAACVAGMAWRRRTVAGGLTLALLMPAVAEWSLGAAFEYASVGVAAKVAWSKWEYIGAVSSPVLFLLFALEYKRMDRWLTRRNVYGLFAVPLLTLGLAATNERHGLIWSGFAPGPAGQNLLIYHHGPAYWASLVGYSYLALLLGSALLVRAALRFPAVYRRQTAALLAGVAVPWAGDLCYNLGLVPIPGLEVTPLLLTFSGAALAGSIFRFRLFDLVPVAREALIEMMPEGVLVLDAQSRLVDINPAARRLLDVPDGDGPGSRRRRSWRLARPGAVAAGRTLERARRGAAGRLRGPTLPGTSVSPLRDRRGRGTGRLVLMRDVTARKRAEADLQRAYEQQRDQLVEIKLLQSELREQAIRDPLTGLFNRRHFDAVMARELARAAQSSGTVSLVAVDLDHFKSLNDTHGHPAGDAVLAAFGDFLQARTWAGETVCRIGGEEFVVILPGTTPGAAFERADQWRSDWAGGAVAHGGRALRGTLSGGIAAFPDHGATPDEVLGAADLALYDAKAAGRNRVALSPCPLAQAA